MHLDPEASLSTEVATAQRAREQSSHKFPRSTEPLIPGTSGKSGAPKWVKPLWLLLSMLSILTILTAAFLFFVQQQSVLSFKQTTQPSTLPGTMVGSAGFESSRLYNQQGTSGVSDEFHLTLQKLDPPAVGEAYYAWLLPDTGVSDGQPLLVGLLSPPRNVHGVAVLTYAMPDHRNLLATYSRFLITEEDVNPPPLVPSLDPATWRYQGAIPNTPSPHDDVHHYSLLNHLRHLLAQDPTLEQLGLHSGLDYWQYKDCAKLIEWTQSARDDWGQTNTPFLRRQLIRTLDYIDGTAYVAQDVPPNTPLLVDPKLQRIGLIDVTTTQTLEGLFPHIDYHLTSLVTSPGATAQQQQLATHIMSIINTNVVQLHQIEKDAKALLLLSDRQLRAPAALTLLDAMANLSNDVFVSMSEDGSPSGSAWVHQQITDLATFPITKIVTKTEIGT